MGEELIKEKISSLGLYMLMLCMLITGSCNTIFMKVQDDTKAMDPDGEHIDENGNP